MGINRSVCTSRIAVDAAIAVVVAAADVVLTLAGGSWWPAHPGRLAWTLLAVQTVVCLSLVARRRAPMVVAVVMAAFTLTVSLLVWPGHLLHPVHDGNCWGPLAAVVASYGPLMCPSSRRRAFTVIALLTVTMARPWQPSLAVITIGVLRTGVGPLLAMYFDARRRLVAALTERAERAEREQHLLADQARSQERARLAGEMHDIVTHRVSLMVLQAGALQVSVTDEPTRRAVEELRAAGCLALDELRDLVGILRTAPEGDRPVEAAPPTAGLSALAALAAESSSVGTPTVLDVDGEPELASPVVGRTVQQIVREALTNVRKHAPGARAGVRVRYGPTSVRLTVSNTERTRPVDAALVASGSGSGLAALRQRVELVHGTLHAGPDPAGGFRVEATLPAYVPTDPPANPRPEPPVGVPAGPIVPGSR